MIDNMHNMHSYVIGVLFRDSFRCGLFFPDPADKSPDKSALPYLNLYRDKLLYRFDSNGIIKDVIPDGCSTVVL